MVHDLLVAGLLTAIVSAGAQVPTRSPDIYFAPTRHAIADAMLTLAGVGPNDVTFSAGDFFAADISRATVVMLYLNHSTNLRLEPKLRQELPPGTRIVSHQFPIGHWAPEKTVVVDGIPLLACAA